MWAVRMMMMMIKIVLVLISTCLHVVADTSSGSAGFQALFVFGDSLLDCGNRRELKPTATSLPYPIIDADHQPYGRDFPTHLPTGRFSNGLVGADILASFMGLPYPPPYLQDRSNFMKGCSFASAGAKVVNNTKSYQFPRLHFIDQVRLFAEVQQQLVVQLGDVQAGYFLSKSLILTCLGANDYLSDYYTNIVQLINPSEEVFRQNLIASYSNYIQILYSLGARKFAVVSIAPLGCIPALEYLIQGDDTQCLSSINEEVRIFNVALLRMTAQLQEAYPDAHFVFLDSFDLSLDVATHPAKYDACLAGGVLVIASRRLQKLAFFYGQGSRVLLTFWMREGACSAREDGLLLLQFQWNTEPCCRVSTPAKGFYMVYGLVVLSSENEVCLCVLSVLTQFARTQRNMCFGTSHTLHKP